MKQEEIISNAIAQAIGKGIKIKPTPAIFDFTNGYDKPISCCPIGAVCLAYDIVLVDKDGVKRGWLSKVAKILDVNELWIWKFNCGCAYGNQLRVEYIDSKTKENKIANDEVSKLGLRIRKLLQENNNNAR